MDTDSQIAEAWIRCHEEALRPEKGKLQENNPDLEAWIILNDYALEDPERALKIMDKIVAGTDNKMVLGNIGAGPLENLLGSDKGPPYQQEITDRARRDKKWRHAFGCVWTTGFKNKELADQVENTINKFFPYGRP